MNTQEVILDSGVMTSSMLTGMIIYQDETFLIMAVFSAFVGILTALSDLDQAQKLKVNFYTFFTISKGGIIGFLVAPFMMLSLMLLGTQIAEKFGLNLDGAVEIINSLYFLSSLIFSRVIAKWIFKYIDKEDANV